MVERTTYRHTQQAPLCLLVYLPAMAMFVAAWICRNQLPQPLISMTFGITGIIVGLIATAFHHLTIEDHGEQLVIQFGPLPLFRRAIRYDEITHVEMGRTTLLDGWGIHFSLRGGWVWNLWGRDCVTVHRGKRVLHLGSDDAENLARFLKTRMHQRSTNA